LFILPQANQITNRGANSISKGIESIKSINKLELIIKNGNKISEAMLNRVENSLKSNPVIRSATLDFRDIKTE